MDPRRLPSRSRAQRLSLFLAVREQDIKTWQDFFERFGIPTGFERRSTESFDDSLQVVLEDRPAVNPDYVEGYPVVSRSETIEFMQDHYATFQSALAMLSRMYDDVDLEVAYRESEWDC